ncbi:class I SAM-dependent methyltransferase [Rhodobacteraceae bacterium NNCM2]|nr:class I SAM-dependent methyltransferase [Coraliihabitans acroporae]
MRISCVTMVKNEGAIIHEFAAHLLTMFDDIIFVDHLSDDGTAEFLGGLAQDYPGVEVVQLRSKGYFQSATMNAICRAHPVIAKSDWVFLVDADEMLPFETRLELETVLNRYSDTPFIRLPWYNLVPVSFDHEGLLRREFLRPKKPAQHRKVAFQPKLMSTWPIFLGQGNHEIYATEDGSPLPGPDAFPMLHAPVRTFTQLEQKLTNGLKSYREMGKQWDETLGTHWIEIEKKISSGALTASTANYVAAHYGEPAKSENWELSHDQMRDRGYAVTVLHGALLDTAEDLRGKYWPETPAAEAPATGKWVEIDQETGKGRLVIDGAPAETVVPANQSLTIDIDNFSTLTGPHPVVRTRKDDADPIVAFLAKANRPIECLTPTSWGGHIPFMYALMTQMCPRRTVELGSHNGASFFATCQALKSLDGHSQAVAVDLWQGDEHAGFYTEDVYRNFSYILRTRFSEVGTSIREDFTEASKRFAPGSIDVLHIDGLHTYEAVKHDYETWLPKLSENGTILFHDTNVYERGFGVYKFWEEIKDLAPSFNFHHTHGLGVLALGDQNPMAPVLKAIKERGAESLIESHFAHLGSISIDAAQYRMSMRERAKQATNKAAPLPIEAAAAPAPLHKKKKKPFLKRVTRELSKGLRKLGNLFSGR